MFWFCKPKPIDVYFYTTREDIFAHAKPQKAINFFPNWAKNLPHPSFPKNDTDKLIEIPNIKSCPGFINLYKTGFVLPLWSDLNIEIKENGAYKYQFADNKSVIESHNPIQSIGNNFEQTYAHLKLVNPWLWETKEKVNFLFSAPVWNGFGYENAVVAPGIYSAHLLPIEGNINLFFKKWASSVIYQLKFGQPLVHVIPISDRPLKLHHKLITQEELESRLCSSPIQLMFKNRYRRAEKLCPHA